MIMIRLYGLTYQYGHERVNRLIGNKKYKDLSFFFGEETLYIKGKE